MFIFLGKIFNWVAAVVVKGMMRGEIGEIRAMAAVSVTRFKCRGEKGGNNNSFNAVPGHYICSAHPSSLKYDTCG